MNIAAAPVTPDQSQKDDLLRIGKLSGRLFITSPEDLR
jgi:hypothetical protein